MDPTLRTRERIPDGDSSEPEDAAGARSDVRERILALVSIAAEHESALTSTELHALLPAGAFEDAEQVESFLRQDAGLRAELLVVGGEVVPRGASDLAARRAEQRKLSSERVASASRYVDRLLRVCPSIELVAISGSTAYDGAKPQDDIDFFIVTSRNRMWLGLLLAMGVARLERWRDPAVPVFCLNRITERGASDRAFRETRDPLFAREALNLRVVHGQEVYADLLRASPWMGETFPALYALRLSGTPAETAATPRRRRAGGFVANVAAFALLAPYLWLAGLVRNVALERAGRHDALFRTVIAWDFCAYESRKYDELRAAYRRSF